MSKLNDALATIVAELTASVVEHQGQPIRCSPPWDSINTLPTNATTHIAYRGGNTVLLWASQLRAGYPQPLWATYKQWATIGGQVRKGEHGTTCVHWSVIGDDLDQRRRLVPSPFTVFNLAQQDGVTLEPRNPATFEDPAEFEAYRANIPAIVGHGQPAYRPSLDMITLPDIAAFHSAAAYVATAAHEYVHWTGHTDRCDRQLKSRFGDAAYAAEELVAEIGAAFLTARFGVYAERREDHATYIRSWLKELQDDPTRLLTAAQHAQRAVDHLDTYQPVLTQAQAA